MDKLERLVAKGEIEDVLFRYARAIDRRDWPALRTCFHPDATDSHGAFLGSPEEFIAWVSARHAAIPFAQHFLGNCLIEFRDARTAAVETYFVAFQRRETTGADGEAVETDYQVFGRYCDRFERRGEDGWRVAARTVVYDGTSSQPSTDYTHTLTGVFGRRDRSDPVFSILPAAAE
jgi:3-phenylpropionate/cinnamic acid dioxygenase small subunit